MIGVLVAVSAIVPSLLIMRYFHARDRYPEPRRVLWAAFGLGVLSIFGVLLILPAAVLVDQVHNPWIHGTLSAFFTAAIPEELLKLAVLYFYVLPHKEFDEPIDGLIYGAAVSLGFATLENILYVAQGGMAIAAMRALTAVPAHAFSGAILGYFVAKHKFEKKKGALLEGYFIVVVLHGLYDAPILTMKALSEGGREPTSTEQGIVAVAFFALSVGMLAVEVLWARSLLLRLRDEQDGPMTKARKAYEQRSHALSTSSGLDFLLLSVGFLLASIGGLFAIGLAVAAVFDPGTEIESALGGLVIGLPLLVLGFILFSKATRRIDARQKARHEAWAQAAAQMR